MARRLPIRVRLLNSHLGAADKQQPSRSTQSSLFIPSPVATQQEGTDFLQRNCFKKKKKKTFAAHMNVFLKQTD